MPPLRTSRRPLSRSLWESVKWLLPIVVTFFVARTALAEAYRISSGSMEPTLLVGDWLVVNKVAYGPHIPFTTINLPGYTEPKRGDVVVFISPPQPDEQAIGHELQPLLVKRLQGVAGDTLFMRDGVLYVNGVAQHPSYLKPESFPQNSIDPLFDWQKTVGLSTSRFGTAPVQPTHDSWGPLVVPPGRLFMMGDNRYHSKDSRYWGFVPRENVRGTPMFVYYSFNADDSDRPWPAITDIRWTRIGHWIR